MSARQAPSNVTVAGQLVEQLKVSRVRESGESSSVQKGDLEVVAPLDH